ncbi:hypothetical protein, partial [Alteripontixanthobacter muriae]|uniref:hypothetical protein n=1 Tax=Alteripontixanthobacter muriae TaxID=2705546 RepID=UPI0019D522C0
MKKLESNDSEFSANKFVTSRTVDAESLAEVQLRMAAFHALPFFLRSESMSHHKFILAAGSLAFASAFTAPAQAATLLGVFGGNDCTGGFSA